MLVAFSAPVTRAADDDIRLNTIGYLPDAPKVATIVGTAGSDFSLKRVGDDSAVLSGELSNAVTDPDTNQSVRKADFTAVAETGNYYLEVPDVGRSLSFPIGRDVFAQQLVTAMLGYYGWRSGTAVEFTHQGQTFRQGPGHLQDGLLDYIGQAGVSRDGSHGWYDAGDYGKYTVNGAFTLGMLLRAWESFSGNLENVVLPIPEQGGTFPDYLDELKWQFDWLFTMQYSATDGRVSHKLTSLGFAPFIMPEADLDKTYYSPYGSAATADFVAAMAFGSRVYRPYDATLADRMLAAASLSYQWLQANTANVSADISAFSTGAYQTQDRDDRVWAAAEMWETTGDAAALADFETRASAGTSGTLVDVDFDWGNTRNLGVYTYLLSARSGRTASVVESLRAALLKAANSLVSNRNNHAYGRALTKYYWGVNGAVARTCMNLQVANQLSPNKEYLDTCADQIAHLYGRNYYNRSYVTGAGKDPPLNPHHRPSGADGIATPFPGLLVGGPQPTATSWQDVESEYTVNEVAINWNGALVFALAGFASESENDAGTGGAPATDDTPTGGAAADLPPDAGTSLRNAGLVALGGGCNCRTSQSNPRNALGLTLLGVLGLVAARRVRRYSGRARSRA
jgi:endoglucanase